MVDLQYLKGPGQRCCWFDFQVFVPKVKFSLSGLRYLFLGAEVDSGFNKYKFEIYLDCPSLTALKIKFMGAIIHLHSGEVVMSLEFVKVYSSEVEFLGT